MDDESLEDQMNQAQKNLPARIPEVFNQKTSQEEPPLELRTATQQSLAHNDKDRDRSNDRNHRARDLQQGYALSSQIRKMGRAISEAGLSANSLGTENQDSLATEMAKETGDVALLGAAGFVRGIKSGFAAGNKDRTRKDPADIAPASPDAIEAFIASLPPPPMAIAPPVKRLPAPGRSSGQERD